MAKLIKAFHQVGGDDTTSPERKALLKKILDLGQIVPAIDRVERGEMEIECFGDSQGAHDIRSFDPSPSGREALTALAREKLELLPVNGTTHTMFNCLDLLAGDFELVFLSIGDWYNYPNGFVFDAEELLLAGAGYRPKDLLGYYRHAVEKNAAENYDSIEEAMETIEDAMKDVRDNFESTGKQGVTLLRADCAAGRCPGEITWPGPLPLGLAIEMWREGRKTTFKEGARR